MNAIQTFVTVGPRRLALMSLCAAVLGGCAALPPRGAPIQRLPEGAAARLAPKLTPEQSKKLTELDARLLQEQEDDIRNRHAWAAYNAALRDAWNANTYYYGGYGPWFGPRYGFGYYYGPSPWGWGW
ncbi:hypothetical protein [Pandoraea sp.]|uniref:hypothetical protein n=1 Tax=Pandoraea sp. TaxID=1883445 RepID=UPI001226EECD|nr:hypothetical protein [Pandoraea sp.]TAL54811.1 MAG: hypothetical protein EPN80_09990 [Pandoraea sp.]TAM18421.1 MAG: hypothetical protein EPN65_06650 [Pandoraea sp.]